MYVQMSKGGERMRKIKRIIASVAIVFMTVLSIQMIAYASGSKTASYTYPNGYKMSYKLYSATISGSSGAAAYTDTDNSARAFVSVFGYDSSGYTTNSGSKTQDYYVYLGIRGKGAKTFKSYHSLLYSNNRPIEKSKNLKIE